MAPAQDLPPLLTMFANLLKQYEGEGRAATAESLSYFFAMVAVWGLVRMAGSTDLEARRQYGLFVNHLQNAEGALLKALQIHQKSLLAKAVPPSRVVTSLPITTTTQL
ncbi:MAG: hypothetical protein EBY17_31035 [Acidobacteriia bacterium]|nr:hypothetical protein [Terriglobia bacterium]